MAAKDDTAITEEMEDTEVDSSPASILLLMTSYMKRLSDRLDAFVTAHEPSKHSDYPSRVPPPPAKRPTRDDPTLSEDKEVDKEEEQDTRAKKARTFEVSSATKAFLETSFCLPKPVDNATRRAWLDRLGLPLGDETRCPKMDNIIKGELGKEALEADRKLSRLQNFTLDAAAPLVAALEELTEKEEPDLAPSNWVSAFWGMRRPNSQSRDAAKP